MTNELKEIIRKEYEKIWGKDARMVDYCTKKVSDAVLLESGMIFIFEKPKLTTDFCFGYHLSSYDTESFDNANSMVHHVENDGGAYFAKKNLESFDRFDESISVNEILLYEPGYGNSNIVTHFNPESNLRYARCISADRLNAMIAFTPKDIENIKKVNASERAKMEKRINAYLKRYGTSKLNCWSYWRDA